MTTHKPSPTLRQRLRAAAAEAMLDSAERVMVENGYEGTTMQQIAEEAGCAAGTLYLYFKNKEELFQAMVARHAAAVFGAARLEFGKGQDPVQRVRRGAVAILRYSQQHRPFFRLFFTAMPMRLRGLHEKLGDAARREH